MKLAILSLALLTGMGAQAQQLSCPGNEWAINGQCLTVITDAEAGGQYPFVLNLDNVTIHRDIRYCNETLDAKDDCVMHGSARVDNCPKGEHRSIVDVAGPPTGFACAGTTIEDCLTHHLIDVCEKD